MDIEPLHRNTDLTAILEGAIKHFGAVSFGSTSLNTMPASFPPSSNVIRLSRPAPQAITFAPVAVEPVNEIFRTSGCAVSAAPKSFSSVMKLTTPAGTMSLIRAPMRSVLSGVVGAGLITHCVASNQCWRQFECHQDERKVPRDNRANNAKRASVRFDFSAFTVVDDFHGRSSDVK